MFKNIHDAVSFKTRVFRWLLLIIVAYIPFYRFAQAWLENHTQFSAGTVFWLSHWYEPAIIILIFYYFVIFLFQKKRKIGAEFILALILIIGGVISIFYGSQGISRGLEGFRFLLLPLVIFVIAYTAGFSKKNLRTFINVYIISALIIAIWAIIEQILPSNYWSLWAVLSSNATTWFGGHTVDGLRQSVSLIGGPNQLAAYLLPAFFISLISLNNSFKKWRWIIIIIIGAAIVFTFSRSAWIGLVVGLILFFILHKEKLVRWIGLASFVLVAVATLLTYQFGSAKIQSIFTHGASQTGHAIALEQSIREIKARVSNLPVLFLGSGLGTAGPASIKYSDGIVSESWYLEVILELGFVGLFVWLMYFFFILKKTVNTDRGLFLGFVSIAVASLFLHTLSDNPAGTFILFALIGIQTSLPIDQNTNKG